MNRKGHLSWRCGKRRAPLARCLAEKSSPTVIVDTPIRRPRVSRSIMMESCDYGIGQPRDWRIRLAADGNSDVVVISPRPATRPGMAGRLLNVNFGIMKVVTEAGRQGPRPTASCPVANPLDAMARRSTG